MQQLTFPMPPTEEECQLYYYGLTYCPRLVARSSSHVWVKRQLPNRIAFAGTENMAPKALKTVTEHAFMHIWNNPIYTLQMQITLAASAAQFISIDLFGIGYDDGVNKDFPITLIVTVRPRSLPWSEGYAIARTCKLILESFNIHDVECEIRELVMVHW
ncbi:hypothetical protein M431DRAFT_485027 [Trichoderma harzianum CBS 226.95]|uniref:Uncharacterized protein n=1 Tax=Trichoderma harzianum CBS 226.95 TaxID=983964 RepID=A0A2T4A251_TRIHA|nr:hypothetical protein M431DRAFT_485027 [Trichoderma harzianum CBS 226.95]PTB51151.1 hypothetical protein M431DRAFT_485027 [Trichoderma harzianum CBS 226.95]